MKLSRFLLLLGSAVLLFMVGLLAFNFLVMPRLIHHNEIVAVPDLRGKPVQEARGEAGRAGLQLVERRQAAHPTVPAGSIVDQQPRGGVSIRRGRRVDVTVSSGPAMSLVPDLSGLSRRQAELTLAREALRPGRLLRLRDDAATVPTIAFQDPPAGLRQRSDGVVDLVVAEPGLPPAYRLPDLTGVSLYRARAAIEAAGCVAGKVTYDRRRGSPPGTVVGQDPAPGSRILKGASIDLVASSR